MFTRGTGPLVSLLFPCRTRFDWLREAVSTFLSAAGDGSQVEVLVKFDSDDVDCIRRIQELPGDPRVVIYSRGKGYSDLHCFYNDLCRLARGDWVWLLNDDARMKTMGWDRMLADINTLTQTLRPESGLNRVCLLNPLNHHGRPSTVFPLIRRAATLLTGHFSPSPVNDHYLNEVYAALDAKFDFAVEVEHLNDHPDGQVESRKETISQAMSTLEHHQTSVMQEIVRQDIAILRKALRSPACESP